MYRMGSERPYPQISLLKSDLLPLTHYTTPLWTGLELLRTKDSLHTLEVARDLIRLPKMDIPVVHVTLGVWVLFVDMPDEVD